MDSLKNTTKYDDIIELPHHVSPTRPRMSAIDRAAQFSPFAALTGYEAAIKETGRLTDDWVEPDESQKAVLNEKLRLLAASLAQRPEITITCFCPDERKSGGSYERITGTVKRIDEYESIVRMTDGRGILIDRICRIEGNLFNDTDFD